MTAMNERENISQCLMWWNDTKKQLQLHG